MFRATNFTPDHILPTQFFFFFFTFLGHAPFHFLTSIPVLARHPSSLVQYWDQAGVKLISSQNWTMEQQRLSHVEIAGINDKRQITLTFAGLVSGELLPLQLLCQRKTACHSHFCYPSEFDVWHTLIHWANKETTLQFINNIILSYVKAVQAKNNTPDQVALMFYKRSHR